MADGLGIRRMRTPRFKINDKVICSTRGKEATILNVVEESRWPYYIRYDEDAVFDVVEEFKLVAASRPIVTDQGMGTSYRQIPYDEISTKYRGLAGYYMPTCPGSWVDAAGREAPSCDCGGLKTYKVISKETCARWCKSQGKR